MTTDPNHFVLRAFDEVCRGVGASWNPWRAFLAALFGVPAPDVESLYTFRTCTGRATWPAQTAREAWVVVGRRGGKSRIAAFLAVFLACFRTYPQLAAGEKGVVMVMAADRRQARVSIRYIKALIASTPMLAALVVDETKDSIELSTGIVIEIHTSSFRAVRGYTCIAAITEEIAFWDTGETAANPDTEIIGALKPAMATIPGALLIAVSSPYARRGELWRAYAEHFGQDGDPVLVWQADSRTMNPALDQAVVDRAYEDDAASAAAEYGAQFRTDLETFVSREVLEGARVVGRGQLPRIMGVKYVAFTDPAGGSGGDSYTLAIAHSEPSGRHVVDCVREIKPPFSPERATGELAGETLRYGVTTVHGDRYAGEWPREQWAKRGVTYLTSDKTKSELYLEALPLLTGGRVELLDDPRLLKQLGALERRSSRAGKDSVDHPPRQHDDVANAVCGVLARLTNWRANSPAVVAIKVRPSEPEPSHVMAQLRAAKTRRRLLELGYGPKGADA